LFELQKLSKDKKRNCLISAVQSLLSSTKVKNFLENETEFRKAVNAFDINSFYTDDTHRAQFISIYEGMDKGVRALFNGKKE